MRRLRNWIMAWLVIAVPLLPATTARAQPYPRRPVTLVVPFPPGGSADVGGRLVARFLGEALGVPVVVDNRGGAGGTIGAASVARAAPDGYTILLATSGTFGVGPSLYPSLPYDTLRDFAPVTQVSASVYLLVVHPSVPARTLQELVAASRRDGAMVTYGSGGNGNTTHLFMELLRERAGHNLTHVPYRGAGPMMNALMSGEVGVTMDSAATLLPLVRDGSLRALAVSSADRSSLLPDVPTIGEAGVPGFSAVGWSGLVVPAGASPEVVQRLNQAMLAALRRPEMQALMEQQGSAPVGNSPEAFGRFMADEIARWRDVIRRIGMTID